MDHSAVVINTSDLHLSDLRSFSGRGEYNLLFNLDIVKFLLKSCLWQSVNVADSDCSRLNPGAGGKHLGEQLVHA